MPQKNRLVVAVLALATLAACSDAVSPNQIVQSSTTLTAMTSTALVGRVGASVEQLPSVRVTDQRGAPVAGAAVSATTTGGGIATASPVTDGGGVATVGSWTLGTTAGRQTLTLAVNGRTVTFTADAAPGELESFGVVAGDAQVVRAGTVPAVAVQFAAFDEYGNGIAGRPVTFAVDGGGSLGATTTITDAQGRATVSAWTVGKTVTAQRVRATLDTLTAVATLSVETAFAIDVRFYGPEMSAADRALFTDAAARLSAIIVGDVRDVGAYGIDVATACGIAGVPMLNEVIDDVVIYAAIKPIDGAGKVLARAGPCAFRGAIDGGFAAVGAMEFDADDLANLSAQGRLGDVIMHEMLHVLGIGTMWPAKSFLLNAGTTTVSYTGANGIQGCAQVGGTTTCATSVPVENTGGSGTAGSHWRESVFGAELMTGYANASVMPISLITTGGLADLGYLVNHAAADSYMLPTGGALFSRIPVEAEADPWEQRLPGNPVTLGGAR